MKTWWTGLAGAALLAALALGMAAWWLHENLDGLVKKGIAHYGSQMTQARVAVDTVRIQGADGRGVLRGLVVGNPAGFRTPHALKVGLVEVAVDLRTLADPVVVVHRIVIDAPDVIYEKSGGSTNFEALQRNIARAAGTSPTPARKLIVDELVIRGARARASTPGLAGHTVAATLPDIRLRHVGRAQGGVTPEQLGEQVTRALSQRLVASLSPAHVLKSVGDRVKGWLGR